VAGNADTRIVVQYALDPAGGIFGAVSHRDLAGVQRVPHTHAAPMMETDPACARCRIQQRIQNGPICNCVCAVEHFLSLAIRAGDRSRIEVIAADGDGRRDFALAHQLVDRQSHLRALTVTEPADARRQALKREAAACEFQPAGENLIFRKELERQFIGSVDVFGIA